MIHPYSPCRRAQWLLRQCSGYRPARQCWSCCLSTRNQARGSSRSRAETQRWRGKRIASRRSLSRARASRRQQKAPPSLPRETIERCTTLNALRKCDLQSPGNKTARVCREREFRSPSQHIRAKFSALHDEELESGHGGFFSVQHRAGRQPWLHGLRASLRQRLQRYAYVSKRGQRRRGWQRRSRRIDKSFRRRWWRCGWSWRRGRQHEPAGRWRRRRCPN